MIYSSKKRCTVSTWCEQQIHCMAAQCRLWRGVFAFYTIAFGVLIFEVMDQKQKLWQLFHDNRLNCVIHTLHGTTCAIFGIFSWLNLVDVEGSGGGGEGDQLLSTPPKGKAQKGVQTEDQSRPSRQCKPQVHGKIKVNKAQAGWWGGSNHLFGNIFQSSVRRHILQTI